jgi:hypothetical protein
VNVVGEAVPPEEVMLTEVDVDAIVALDMVVDGASCDVCRASRTLSTSGRMSANPDVAPRSARSRMFRSILNKWMTPHERGRQIVARVKSKNHGQRIASAENSSGQKWSLVREYKAYVKSESGFPVKTAVLLSSTASGKNHQ